VGMALTAAEYKSEADSKTPNARDAAASPTTHKANDMIGSSVQTKSGEKLGTIRDFAFALPSGDLSYVIVASGGILGLGAEYHAVPPKALSHETQNPKVLTLDTTKEKWEAAPKFKKDQLPNLNAHREQLDKYFEGSNDAKAEVKIGDAKAEVKVRTPDIRSGGSADMKAGALHLATDVIGKPVVAKNNDDVGKVSDLLVDMRAPSIAFAIISTGTLLKPTDTRYAIATKNLSLASEKSKVVLNADRATLENSERFDPNEWRKNKTSAGYFKYEETDAKAELVIDDNRKDDAKATVSTTDGTSALSLVKEGNRYVGEQAKDKIVQIRSERSVNGLKPSVWYVVFYDATAALKATEVKFVNGKMTDVKRPLRLLEATSDRSLSLDRSKIKLDSDDALQTALKEPALQTMKPSSSELRLERGETGTPVWKVQLWGAKTDDSKDDASLGTVTLSAEDGKTIRSDLKTDK
jgi:sporulation protein YlmC with PRC-barrel domain